MSNCTMVGVPRMMVRYNWQMMLGIFQSPLRSWRARTMAISVPRITERMMAKKVMMRVLPKPWSIY